MEVREPSAKYLARPAYKQTEAGLIPEDWEVKALLELATIKTGPFGTLLKASEYSGGDGVPLISVGEIRDGVLRVTDGTPRVSQHIVRRLPQYVLKEGDIVFGRKGGVDRSALIRHGEAGWFLGSDGISVRPAASCHGEYLGLQFQSARVKGWLLQNAIGTTMPSLNQGILEKVVVPFPPTKAEQQAIAEALSDADALIESLEQLLAKKRQIKQGAMQELLTGQKRLPGFAGQWEVKRLGEVVQLRKERIDPRRIGAQEFCVELEHIDQGSGNLIGHTATGEGSSLKSVFREDDVLFGKLRAYLRKYWLATIDGVCSTEIWVLIAKPPVLIPRFLFQLVKVDRFIEAASSAYGTHMPRSDWNVVKNYEVNLPSIEEQTAIAAVLSDMDAELAALEAKLAKARDLKQGMMQELLTGRIRLVPPMAEVIPFPARENANPAREKSHNWQINEAVVISVLAKHFGSEQWPLGRKRYTKLSYLLHRHVEHQAEGYLKKAAGPYNPATKYKGPEGIALKNGYIRQHARDQFSGFVAAEKISEAEDYFSKWYGEDALVWLKQFRLEKNDELELLATVDMAMEDLCSAGKPVALTAVKQVIRSHPEWQAKLDRPIFSDTNIERAIAECHNLFGH